MKNYKVTLTIRNTFYVSAETPDEAEEKAFDADQGDYWLPPYDEIITEEIKDGVIVK